MKLKINKACDLASISGRPPRPRGSGGGGTSASASAAAAAASQQRSQSRALVAFSQGGGGGVAALSQGGGGGGAAFSQGGGGGVAALSQGGGGGGAAFSQGGGDGGGASFSQGGGSASLLHSQSKISQASLDDNLLRPSPARDQRFGLHDDSSKRMSSFHANSASCVREESQLQLAKIPSNPVHRWNHSLPDSKCQINEEVERKLQHVASSVHKMGMVLDSVQNDIMQLNRAVKEASLDSGSIQKKFVLVEDSLQQILKGSQDDIKALLLDSTKSNPDQMSVLTSHARQLDELSSTLSVFKQVQEDLKQLKGDIFTILTKEMEGIARAIKSLNSRPDGIQTLAVPNGKQMKQTPVANGQVQANGTPQMKQTAAAAAAAAAAAEVAPAVQVNGREMDDVKANVEEGNVVKAGAQKVVASSCCMVAPKQEELAIQKVNLEAPAKKAPLSIFINLDDDDEEEEEGSGGSAKPGAAGDELMMNGEEVSKDALEILRRARKRRRREATQAIAPIHE